jgi:hypothetical protein
VQVTLDAASLTVDATDDAASLTVSQASENQDLLRSGVYSLPSLCAWMGSRCGSPDDYAPSLPSWNAAKAGGHAARLRW